jgi:DNA-binding transcriptional LysR family regulator
MAAWLLPPVLQHWRLRRPEVTVDLIEFGNSDQMTEQVFAGGADFAIGPRPTDLDVELELLGREEMVLVCADDHPYAQRASVSVNDITKEPFIRFHQSNSLADWLDELASQHGAKFAPFLSTHSSRTAVQLAAAGIGVTIAPVSALAPHQPGAVLRLTPALRRDIVVIGAARADTLVRRFVADLKRQGVPDSPILPAVVPHPAAAPVQLNASAS